mmetsp:Transcript_25218/g.41472  ORF Transcript_25218/g.41472 Transcript_25218/m.41472 type:complete len:601 (+) Transcript_25218:777-2579(+)
MLRHFDCRSSKMRTMCTTMNKVKRLQKLLAEKDEEICGLKDDSRNAEPSTRSEADAVLIEHLQKENDALKEQIQKLKAMPRKENKQKVAEANVFEVDTAIGEESAPPPEPVSKQAPLRKAGGKVQTSGVRAGIIKSRPAASAYASASPKKKKLQSKQENTVDRNQGEQSALPPFQGQDNPAEMNKRRPLSPKGQQAERDAKRNQREEERVLKEQRKTDRAFRRAARHATLMIQRIWRGHKARRKALASRQEHADARPIDLEDVAKNEAARSIQQAWRSHNAHRVVATARGEANAKALSARLALYEQQEQSREKAATDIQAYFRGAKARMAFEEERVAQRNDAASTIQRTFRCKAARSAVQSKRSEKEDEKQRIEALAHDQLEQLAAKSIQKAYRSHNTRMAYQQRKQQRQLGQARNEAAVRIQCAVRTALAIARARAKRIMFAAVKEESALLIQKTWHGSRARRLAKERDHQAKQRQNSLLNRSLAVVCEDAASMIQTAYRGHLHREKGRQVLAERQALERAVQRKNAEETAALQLQRSMRGWLARRKVGALKVEKLREQNLRIQREYEDVDFPEVFSSDEDFGDDNEEEEQSIGRDSGD